MDRWPYSNTRSRHNTSHLNSAHYDALACNPLHQRVGLRLAKPLYLEQWEVEVTRRDFVRYVVSLGLASAITGTRCYAASKIPQKDVEQAGSLDPLFDRAVEVSSEYGWVSVSLIQRRFRIGYQRGSKLVRDLEQSGVVEAPDTDGVRIARIDSGWMPPHSESVPVLT